MYDVLRISEKWPSVFGMCANCQRGVSATVMLRRRLLHCRRDLTEQPLMTAASRRTRVEVEMSRYKRVIVRVQFPDRLVMQALFRTTETGRSLHDCCICPVFRLVCLLSLNIHRVS